MEKMYSAFGYEIPVRLINITGAPPEVFEAISRSHFSTLQKYARLDPSQALLEIGCGIGRDAMLLAEYLSPRGSYTGVDIIKDSIDWCQKNITARHPNFSFIHYNVKDQLHNPGGQISTTDIRLPIASDSIDRIILWSVFTHMFEEGIMHYLKEFRRVLKKDGLIYVTWFVVDERVLDAARKVQLTNYNLKFEHAAGPGCYISDPVHPLGAVAYEEKKVRELVQTSGLKLEEPILRGSWSGCWPDAHQGQDATLLTP
jgi:ubiquinone/menaquinone biosynthesis C-methylase UbiE